MKNTAAGVPFILICVLLDILGIGLIIPVLPQLVGDLAGSQSAQAWWLGAMLVAYGLMQFCFAPTLGALSDRYGRRPVLLLGIFGLGIMFLVPALSQSLPVILFSRILGGMFAGNIAVAQAYISDVTDKAHRAAAFGKLGACFGIGFILGPALGGILGENDVRLPFFIAGCLSLLNFLYGIFVLPESLKTREHRAINFKTLNPLSSLARLTKFKYIGALIAVIALSGFAQSMLHSTWTLFTNFRFHWTPFNIGLSLVVMGLVTAVVQGFLLKKLLKLFGEQKLILYLVMLCNFLSIAVPPTLNSIVSHSVPASEQGEAMGTISSVNSLMGVAAPLLGTPLLVHTAAQSPGSMLGGLPYFICALVLALAPLSLPAISLLLQLRILIRVTATKSPSRLHYSETLFTGEDREKQIILRSLGRLCTGACRLQFD